MSGYTILGTTADTTNCDCCGKANLKMTVALRDSEGEVVYFGRACAARAMGATAAQIGRKAAAADSEVKDARYLLERWSRYITHEGIDVALFQENNFPARAWTPAEVRARILKTVNTARARLAFELTAA